MSIAVMPIWIASCKLAITVGGLKGMGSHANIDCKLHLSLILKGNLQLRWVV